MDKSLKARVSNRRLNFSGRLKLKFPLNSLLGSLENYFVFQFVIQNVNLRLVKHDER